MTNRSFEVHFKKDPWAYLIIVIKKKGKCVAFCLFEIF